MADHHGKFFNTKTKITSKENLLIVEGTDDAYFFDKLLDLQNADSDKIEIIKMNHNEIEAFIPLLLKQKSILMGVTKKVAFVVDSDDNVELTVKKAQSSFQKYNIDIKQPNEFVKSIHNGVQFGYTTIPSPIENGNLELTCLRTVPDDKKLLHTVNFYDHIEKEFGVLDKKYKRHVQIYLATMPCETRGIGKSFHDGLLNDQHESLNEIISFLKYLIT